MIKKLTAIVFILFGLSMLFLSGYYLGCNAQKQAEPGIIRNEIIHEDLTVKQDTFSSDSQSMEAAAIAEVCKANTSYRLIEYNEDSGLERRTVEPIPEKLIGLKREEVEAELSLYLEAPSLTDKEKGIVGCVLESFSADEIVVRKTYSNKQISNEFYLVAENNYITVYRTDLETVYMYTGISLDSLSLEKKEEILHCKYIEGLSQLYDYLESCTS